MMKFVFKNVQFLKSAVAAKGYPRLKDPRGKLLPEFAVAGRSNVGKSSLLNHLFNRKGLVKTSSVPGKTQHLNFFSVDESLVVCDLPGYGYAKVPTNVRKKWGPMIQEYLETRESLHLILFLLDIRRTPNDDDLRFLQWAVEAEKSVILVLTKVDKVTKNERTKNTKKILDKLGYENLHHIHYSVTKNVGRNQLLSAVNEALVDELLEETE